MGYEDNNYLMHHGIKGMHWGVRRFRNYDGTLTSAGKAQRRAQSSGGGMSSTTKKRLATAAKVAGAAAAVGGAAYLANRASGGELAGRARAAGAAVKGAYRNSEVGGRIKAARAVGKAVRRNARDEVVGRARAVGAVGKAAWRNSEVGGRVKAARAVGNAAARNARDRVRQNRTVQSVNTARKVATRQATTAARNGSQFLKSAAKAGYYSHTKAGKQQVASQVRKAKHRTNNRRMYGN